MTTLVNSYGILASLFAIGVNLWAMSYIRDIRQHGFLVVEDVAESETVDLPYEIVANVFGAKGHE